MDGETLGHFVLIEKIGEGGMGRVYKARDTRLERLVAIKLLPEARMADTDRRARFVQEARAASALNHPNIVTIHEIGEQDSQTFIVMELVDGKPLNELIPRKGMRLTDALRIAVQVSDALAAAHAAGIVHRDLKPGNIMVDTRGRVKVLDFGLAKLTAPAAATASADDATRTISMEQPRTEEGTVFGSVPYMSPEQAEGRPVDGRSDIFSFGAVLYEMIAGQRAFRGESRASTLAAVVESEPQPLAEIAAATPTELERLVARCLRKDVARRSQNMTDVKLALEELRDESESGKLVRSGPTAPAPAARRWFWPAVAVAALAVAVVAVAWNFRNRGGAAQGSELVRLSPDDGHGYYTPSISQDGRFVVYVSDRGGSPQAWLQQVAGGEPIQLTHTADPVLGAGFVPDGTRIMYGVNSSDGKRGSIEVIPTLGGPPRVLAATKRLLGGSRSPDGRHIAYFEDDSPSGTRLMILPSEGGQPRELSTWAGLQQNRYPFVTWTSDSRYLLTSASKGSAAQNLEDWVALPVDGGTPHATGVGNALRAAGLRMADPALMDGDRVLFAAGTGDRDNVWEIRLAPEPWRARGAPRRITVGTENQYPGSISADGMLALDIFRQSTDLYRIPLSPENGQPAAAARRLTRDGRLKTTWAVGGDPGSLYFSVDNQGASDGYALDLESGKQTLVMPAVANGINPIVAPDGRQIAYSARDGDSYSIRIGEAGAATAAARMLCKGCGPALRFSADSRFVFYRPQSGRKLDPKQKYGIGLIEIASGKARPWLEHPTDSLTGIGTFGEDLAWVTIGARPVGSRGPTRTFILPWREDPVPQPEWIEVKADWENINYSPRGNFFQFFEGARFMAMRFDPRTRTVSPPYEVKFVPGSAETPKQEDPWLIRGSNLIFSRRETTSSIWLMKLPR